MAMTRLRRSLGRFAVAWLLVQSAALAAGPAITAITTEDPLECTCAHGNHTFCPMHHKSAPSPTRCQMRSADASDTAVLSSLFGSVGVVSSSPVAVSAPEPRVTFVVEAVKATAARPASPDPPPPRA
jgi:hypothetical protein